MTRTTYFTLLTITFAFFAFSPGDKKKSRLFEGVVTYKVELIIKNQAPYIDALKSSICSSAEVHFREGNYWEKFDKGFITEEFYSREMNKDYTKQHPGDTLHVIDCSFPGKPIKSITINKARKVIMGISCDELVVEEESKILRYYFNTDTLTINPDWYKKFTFQNKNLIMEKMGVQYLGLEMEYPDFIMSWAASSIKPGKVDEKLFVVPKNAVLVKEPQ